MKLFWNCHCLNTSWPNRMWKRIIYHSNIQTKTLISDVDDQGGDGDLADSLARLILEADPAIAGVGAAEKPILSLRSSGSSLSTLQGLNQPKVTPQPSLIPHPTQLHPQTQLPPGSSISGKKLVNKSIIHVRALNWSFSLVCLTVHLDEPTNNVGIPQIFLQAFWHGSNPSFTFVTCQYMFIVHNN